MLLRPYIELPANIRGPTGLYWGPGLGRGSKERIHPRVETPMSTTNPQPPHGDRHGDTHGQAHAQPHPGQRRAPETEASGATGAPTAASARMSYKFQRLREKIRQAVATGELSGKLPGERALAKRFHVNAKTLSKALTH